MTQPQPRFVAARCPWPDRILQSSETVRAITFGHAGVEYYALEDGRLFRVADEHEDPHAVYPKATLKHRNGVPLRAVTIQDLSDGEYAGQLEDVGSSAA